MSAAMFLLFYVFASFGVAFVLGYSKITLPLRTWLDTVATAPIDWSNFRSPDEVDREKAIRAADWILAVCLRFPARWLLALLECPACLAFWLGAASIYTSVPDFLPFSAPDYALAPILGFANLGAVLSLGLITNLIRTE